MTRPASRIKAEIAHSEKWARKYRREKAYWAAATHEERLPRLKAELREAENLVLPETVSQLSHGGVL